MNTQIQKLPPLGEIVYMEKSEREIAEALILAQLKRRKQKNIEAALSLPDPVEWIEANCWDADTVRGENDYSTARKIRLEEFQKRILRKILTINPHTGRFPYRTIVYSAPKKSGKSAIGGMITSYYAANVESPNSIFILANDREQSSGRVYKASRPTLIQSLGGRKEGKYKIHLGNGTVVQASTSDPDKEAGGTYGLTVWDELWAYKSERARLLWAELMPIATRRNSMRVVVTYAGFEDSSDLLLSLYLSVFKDTSERELAEGARAVEELRDITTTNGDGAEIPCCYEVPDAGMFYFNDHNRRMDWQRGEHGDAHQRESRIGLTEVDQIRLEENRWQVTENRFLEPDDLKASVSLAVEQSRRMTFAIDASQRNDCTALVGVYSKAERYVTAYAKAWYPKGIDIDLDETVAADLIRLFKAGLVHRRKPESGEAKLVEEYGLTPVDVWYDPTQMHAVAMRLRKTHKILLREFNQVKERLLADTFLLQQYQDGNIDNLDDDDLFSHLSAARAEQQVKAGASQIRIVKGTGKHAKPIDLAVAQSMAVWRCSKRPKGFVGGIAQGSAKGWERK